MEKKNLRILVVGFGGCGHTFVISQLQKMGVNTNNIKDKDGWKHITFRVNNIQSIQKNFDKVVYVYNCPFRAICSLFRRKFVNAQKKKLGNIHEEFRLTNISNYLQAVGTKHIDYLGFKEHFDKWKLQDQIPCFFLDMGNLEDFKFSLSEFLERDITQLIENWDPSVQSDYSSTQSKFSDAFDFYQDLYIHMQIPGVSPMYDIMTISLKLPKGNYFVVDNECAPSYLADNVNIESFDRLDSGKLHNGKAWDTYRFGDNFHDFPGVQNTHKFPNTLMSEFNAAKKTMKNKQDALFSVMKTKDIFAHDTSQILMVGLRIGDVFTDIKQHKLNKYLYFPNEYKKLDLSRDIDKTVVLCCGSHRKPNLKQTKAYLLKVHNEFKLIGFKKILFRIGNSPDDDFILMANAVNFIPGKGNFHRLIRDMNLKYKNTNVYDIEAR